jgi:hypothetical protein
MMFQGHSDVMMTYHAIRDSHLLSVLASTAGVDKYFKIPGATFKI